MAFYNQVIFPDDISYGSESILRFQTEVFGSDSGRENRDSTWSVPYHEFDVSYQLKTLDELWTVHQLFMTVCGRLHSFRFKDWLDFTSKDAAADSLSRKQPTPTMLDQIIGIGDGAETDFQLVKRYTAGGETVIRNITAPVSGTVICALDGVATTAFSVANRTGIVTFDSAPGSGVQITAGFEFDCKVRFSDDELPLTLQYIGAGDADRIVLMEVPE